MLSGGNDHGPRVAFFTERLFQGATLNKVRVLRVFSRHFPNMFQWAKRICLLLKQ